MSREFVTQWLQERKAEARVTYLGPGEDDLHVWDLDFPSTEHSFRIGVAGQVVEDDALLSERLMELETQGWLDQAGEKDLWVLIAPAEIAEGPTLFKGEEGRAAMPDEGGPADY